MRCSVPFMKRPIKVYADTSVFGGVFDPEFARPSKEFFIRALEGSIQVVVSELVLEELTEAPDYVQTFLRDSRGVITIMEVSDEAYTLQEAYLSAGIVTRKWEADALHVAIATVSNCRAIVSWNFKHIVNFRRIPLYNGVNLSCGHGTIAIHTPPEIALDED